MLKFYVLPYRIQLQEHVWQLTV